MQQDYYKTLGIQRSAGADEIKSAYRALAKKHHPDVFATKSESEKAQAEAKFKEIQHAYDVLSDPQKKDTYDRTGSEEPQNPFHGGGGGFSGFGGGFGGMGDMFNDIFNVFAGGGGRRQADPNRPGEDVEVPLSLSFKEAFTGIEKEITYSRVEKCSHCNGSGASKGTAFKTCTDCGGRGRTIKNIRSVLGVMSTEVPCNMCGGQGKIITEICPDCRGKARSKVTRTVKVNIPAGVNNNQTYVLRGEGSASAQSGANGNLVIVFYVSNHPLFIREGNDLKMDLPISVLDAVLGANIKIPTMTSEVEINIPDGVQDGQIIRVKGRGFRILGRENSGDLYVKIIIDIPKNLSAKNRAQIKELTKIFEDGKYEKIERYKKRLRDI
ncbi:MAG: molecular chaperone DnaJ [Firmicutes bacterium]|nr:molecular chaperone DnaJ [Bacillota bacterium]